MGPIGWVAMFAAGCCVGAPVDANQRLEQPDFEVEKWTSEQLAVWTTVEQWNDAFEANDVPRYFSYIDDDVTILTPASPFRVEGIAADRREFEFGLTRGYGRVSLFQEFQPHVVVAGNMAFATYYNRGWYGLESDGRMLHLRETDILIRRGDRWKIAHIHVSPAK